MQQVTDDELMQRFQAGQTGAFRVLFEAYWPRVLALLRTRVGDAAEDLTAEAFTRVIRARDRYDPGSSFRAWLYRIAHNLAHDYLRHEVTGPVRVIRLDDPPDAVSDTDDPADLAAANELADAYAVAAGALPEHQRASFELIEAHGMTYDEASIVLDLPVGTVKSHVHRARDRLRRMLARFLEE